MPLDRARTTALAAIILVACGGDDASSASSSASPDAGTVDAAGSSSPSPSPSPSPTADASTSCAPLAPPADAPAAAPLALYPKARFAKLSTLGPKVTTACVDTHALASHASLDALVPTLLAEAGLKQAAPGACACDFALTFASSPPALPSDAAAVWTSAGSNPDRYIALGGASSDGRASSTLFATTEPAALYALRAALASVQSGRLAQGAIVDFASVARRGVVEGIYGPSVQNADCAKSTSYFLPYRIQDRLELIRLMSRLRMSTFMYGPKCDAYSGPGGWRTPYPSDAAQLIALTAREADANLVRFVWAIRPLSFYSGGAYGAELATLKAKLDQLRGLGVRHFALFWDDSYDYAGTTSDQVRLINDVDAYVKSKDPTDHLTVVGQPYCGPTDSFCSGPNAATDAFGAGLHGDIEIFWTGTAVEPTTITASQLAGIDASYKRKVTIWDNWPCAGAGYCGPTGFRGRSADLPSAIQGYYANPVLNEYLGPALPIRRFFEVLGPIADYLWNTSAYVGHEDASYAAWQPLLTALEPRVGAACKPCGSYGAYWTCNTSDAHALEFCDPDTKCLTEFRCPGGCEVKPAGQADICHF